MCVTISDLTMHLPLLLLQAWSPPLFFDLCLALKPQVRRAMTGEAAARVEQVADQLVKDAMFFVFIYSRSQKYFEIKSTGHGCPTALDPESMGEVADNHVKLLHPVHLPSWFHDFSDWHLFWPPGASSLWFWTNQRGGQHDPCSKYSVHTLKTPS